MKNNINKIAMGIIFCIAFMHVLFVLNKRYDGVPYEQYSKYVTESTNIEYFGIIPLWWVNVFYLVYFLYFVLLIFKILKIDLGNKEDR